MGSVGSSTPSPRVVQQAAHGVDAPRESERGADGLTDTALHGDRALMEALLRRTERAVDDEGVGPQIDLGGHGVHLFPVTACDILYRSTKALTKNNHSVIIWYSIRPGASTK